VSEIFTHEDDFCQVELLPLSNHAHCSKEMEVADKFAGEHRAEDGVGWTDMYIRQENPERVETLGITSQTFEELFSNDFTKFDKVNTGCYGDVFESPKTIAFGENDSIVIFGLFNEENVITDIWLTIDPTTNGHRELGLKIFNLIGAKYDLLFVDWSASFMCPLSETESLSKYLDERIAFMQSIGWGQSKSTN
jgi:hypothetical protein